jgi:hypothetical protein
VGTRTRLDPDNTARQITKERQHLVPTQLSANDNSVIRSDCLDLKDVLRDVQTDPGNNHRSSPGNFTRHLC